MDKLTGDSWQGCRCALHLVAMALCAAWLSACGGGSGNGSQGRSEPVTQGGVPHRADDPVEPSEWTPCPNNGETAPNALAECGAPGVICIADFDGATASNLAPLTTGGWPAWSPDGLKIAFHRTSVTADPQVFLIDLDGSGGERHLATGRQPAWSPDGSRIVFASGDGLSVMNEDGSGVTTLIRQQSFDRGHAFVYAPAWSPDGEHIAFSSLPNPADRGSLPASVFVVNADGAQPTRLTPAEGLQQQGYPTWSPFGDRIAFTTRGAIKSVDPAGGATRFLARGIAEFSRPAWSPLGRTIAYTANTRCQPNPAVRTVGSEGEATETLIRLAREPAWSPDASRIAFVTVADRASRAPGGFPSDTGPAQVYVRESVDSFGFSSRYVLYETGRFELQYLNDRFSIYGGSYTRSESGIGFQFDDWSIAGPWEADALVEGDRVVVRYNLIMSLSDFEGGVYIRTGG